MTQEIGQITIEKSAKDWLRDPTTQAHRGKMVNIVNPAGWLLGDGITMHTPITLENFYVRLAMCTIDGYVDAEPPRGPTIYDGSGNHN